MNLDNFSRHADGFILYRIRVKYAIKSLFQSYFTLIIKYYIHTQTEYYLHFFFITLPKHNNATPVTSCADAVAIPTVTEIGSFPIIKVRLFCYF